MKIKYKVIYKDSKGRFQTVNFSKLHCAYTFAHGMDGIVLNVK